MRAERVIPATIAELTPAWLTDALRAGGVMTDASVTDARCETLGAGAGFVGQIARVHLTYDRAAGGGSSTLIAKMPALEEGARELAGIYGLYEREFRFYTELVPEITFRTPRCYFAAGDAESVRYVLLLEDLGATGIVGDQVQGCTPEQATLVLEQLALHHARWWMHPRLTEVPWMGTGIDLVNGAMEQAYPDSWPVALDLFGDRMTPAIRDALPGMNRRISALMERYREGPLTMTHGDYRLDNMFFGKPGSGYGVAVFDWQSPSQAWGAYDIAYFMYGNVDIETRRAHEMDVLRTYHDTLAANGVQGYAWERCVEDYVNSLVVSLGIWIVNAATLDTANERGRELFNLFFDRLAAAITDHDALSRLPA
jgi:hypothetical protein